MAVDLDCIHCAGSRPFDRTPEEAHYYNHCYNWADLRNLLDHHLRRSHRDLDRPYLHGMAWVLRNRLHIHHGRVLSPVVDSFRVHGIPFHVRNMRSTNYLSIGLKNLAILWDGKDY